MPETETKKVCGKDHRYNGWTNYETWAVKLWIDNDEGLYTYWREATADIIHRASKASQVRERIWSVPQARRFMLADALKEEMTDMAPDLGGTLWADLLGAALSEVNWHEIAESMIEDEEETK